MMVRGVQDVFIHLAGQDDNLGDSALRAGYLDALRGDGRRFHIYFGAPSPDYVRGFALHGDDQVYTHRPTWLAAADGADRPVLVLNAGEINPPPGLFPNERRSAELRRAVDGGAILIAAGFGMKDVTAAETVEFDPVLRDAAVVSWRDAASRDAAGFGGVAPDWAYSLGSKTSDWAAPSERTLLAVTLRYDRPWPEASWFEAVRSLAARTSTRIVTLAQVARDAPRAVRLAEALSGEYLTPPSTSHDDLDSYARAVFGRSLAVVSDRAHGLIIAATEGAYPIGSAADPQKIRRLLATAGLGDLVGRYDQLAEFSEELESYAPALSSAIDGARDAIAQLRERIQDTMRAGAR